MREFQERRRLKKFLHSRYAIAVLIVVAALLARAVWGIYGKYEKSKEIAERAKSDLAALEERRDSLERSIESLNTSEGREREIRDRFGAVKEGERLIILVDEEPVDRDAVTPRKQGFWRRLLDVFNF